MVCLRLWRPPDHPCCTVPSVLQKVKVTDGSGGVREEFVIPPGALGGWVGGRRHCSRHGRAGKQCTALALQPM